MQKKTIRQQKQKHYYNLNKIESILWLAEYYKNKNNTKQMLKFYKKASNKKDIDTTIKLAEYYRENKDENNMVKYCDIAIDNGRYDVAICVVNYYREFIENINNYENFSQVKENIIKYCNIFIDNYDENKYSNVYKDICVDLLNDICIILRELTEHELMKKFCFFAIKISNNPYFVYLIGEYYYLIKKDYEKMKYYLWKVINKRGPYIKCMDNYNYKIAFQNSDEYLSNYYNQIEINYEMYKRLCFLDIVNCGQSTSNIFNAMDYYNEKCRLPNESEKDDDDIEDEFVKFLIGEISKRKSKKNRKRCKKLLMECVETFQFVGAMYALAKIHENDRNYYEMKKYYLMAIDYDHADSYIELGSYYEFTENNHEEATKYYKLSFEKFNCEYALEYLTEILFKSQKYDELLEYEEIAINQKYYESIINIGDYYRKIKNYNKMLELYSIIEKSERPMTYDESKIKIALHYQIIENDYEKASDNYNLVKDKDMAIKYISKFSKIYFIYNYIISANKLISDLNECCICCTESKVAIELKCCSQNICKYCVCGIINEKKNFVCPFCRQKMKKIMYLTSDDSYDSYDSDNNDMYDNFSEHDEINNNFINGVYYEDEINNNTDTDTDTVSDTDIDGESDDIEYFANIDNVIDDIYNNNDYGDDMSDSVKLSSIDDNDLDQDIIDEVLFSDKKN
jgi:hypothetical protein